MIPDILIYITPDMVRCIFQNQLVLLTITNSHSQTLFPWIVCIFKKGLHRFQISMKTN